MKLRISKVLEYATLEILNFTKMTFYRFCKAWQNIWIVCINPTILQTIGEREQPDNPLN